MWWGGEGRKGRDGSVWKCVCVCVVEDPISNIKMSFFSCLVSFHPPRHPLPVIVSRYLLNKAALDDQSRAASRMDVKVRERDNERDTDR